MKFKYAISRFIFLFIIVLCITITTHHSFELMILNFFIPGFKNSKYPTERDGCFRGFIVSLKIFYLNFSSALDIGVLKMYYSTVIQARGNLLITLLLVCTGPNDPSVVRNNILNTSR